MDRKKLLKTLVYLIVFILIINFFANKFYWYFSIWYFDIIMHFLGGFWIGLTYFWFFSENFRFSLESKVLTLTVIFKILLFVLAIGIGWEVFEILVNKIIAQNPFDALDTASDIFLDLTGGFFAIFCFSFYFLKNVELIKKNSI